ncbi:MAG: hypothetical protein WCA98_16425 [Candidatus Acidiferrales bacterium]
MKGKASFPLRILIAAAILLPSCGGIANNPSPTIQSLSPTSVTAGAPAFVLTVNGSGFAPQSAILWNNSALATTFLSVSQLTATIPLSLIGTPGVVPVEVETPAPGGGTSLQLNFTINPGSTSLPTITSLNPSSALAGSSGFVLQIIGTNFISSSVVTINGVNTSPALLDPEHLELEIPATDLTTAGALEIAVVNPSTGGGGGSSGNFPLTLTYALPFVSTLSPTSAVAGGTIQTLTIAGSGFVPASVMLFNGSARPTTYTSNTSIAANLTVADLSSAQVAQIVVMNPAPGGGDSTAAIFAVNGIDPTTSNPGFTGLPELVDYSYLGLAPNSGIGDVSQSGPSISANGRYVAFASASSNLTDNDTNGQPDVFLRDTCFAATSCTPTTQLASISGQVGGTSAGSQGNSDSLEPSLNSTGGYIAFASHATNLDPNYPTLTGTTRQIFLRGACIGTTTTSTCTTGFTELVSVSADGVNPANADAISPSVSPDGRYVTFVSTATNLINGVNPGGVAQVYLRDTCLSETTGTCVPMTVLVSSPDGVTPADAPASSPSAGEDGTYVSFTSAASNLVNGVSPLFPQVYRSETCVAGVLDCVPLVTLVSSNDGVTPANGTSGESSITSDGRYVAYASTATNLVQTASSGIQQVFVRDTCGVVTTGCTTSTTLVSIANDNVTPGEALSEQPSISSSSGSAGDGQFVAFASLSTNLVSGTDNGFENVFVRNTCNGALSTSPSCIPGTVLVSASQGGTLANNLSIHPAMSGDGHSVAFISPATNIVANYATGLGDIFLAGTTF